MSELRWGVKASLVAYVRGMPDGRVVVEDGARLSDDGVVVFASDGDLRFRGAISLIGHDGMMHVVLREPRIERDGERWMLSIADPDDPPARLAFTTITAFDGRVGTGVALSSDGADLFFGPYVTGTPFDDLEVTD